MSEAISLGQGVKVAQPVAAGQSLQAMAWRQLWRKRTALIGIGIIVVLVLIAILADVIAPYEPICAGIPLGVISGFYGGALDNVIMRLMDIMLAFPIFLLAIVVMVILEPSTTNVVIALGIVRIPIYARIIRGSVLSIKALTYIEAAKALAVRDLRLLWGHLLPNCMAPIIVTSTLSVGTSIIAEASLSFLGLGTQPPTPSWGWDLKAGLMILEINPWSCLFPGMAIFLTVLAFNLFGDGLRDALETVLTIAQDLQMPNGVAFYNGALYVAEVNRILRYDNIEAHLTAPPAPLVLTDNYPRDTHHGWKFIRLGPDGLLYVTVGAPYNICQRSDERYASITRLKLDGTGCAIVAHGVRNAVGFDWHPETKELWFTDNGRDLLGDDVPSDALNHAPKAGMHFGFPYCHGKDIADPEFGAKRPCRDFVPPVLDLGPHVAALGMRFYTGAMFPPAYRNQIFIAQHGSWNRSKKIGYRVMRVQLQDEQAREYTPFAEGWLQGEKAWRRPVDVQVMPDGALLVSDDYAGVIYRISYQK